MASLEEQNDVRMIQFQLNKTLKRHEEKKLSNNQKNLNYFNESRNEKLIEEQLNKELSKQSALEQQKDAISSTFICSKVRKRNINKIPVENNCTPPKQKEMKSSVKDNIESEKSTDNPSLQTSDESSSISTLEAKAEKTPMFQATVLLERDNIKLSDNLPCGGTENSSFYGELELSSNDVDEVPMWTIPEFIIALCSDNELPIKKRSKTEFHTDDNEVTCEKVSADVESWKEDCLIPSCQHTKTQNTDNVCISEAETSSTQLSSAESPAECEGPPHGYEDVESVLPSEQVFSDSLPQAEKVTWNSTDAKLKKNNDNDNEITGYKSKSKNTAKTQVVIATEEQEKADNPPHVYAKVNILNEIKDEHPYSPRGHVEVFNHAVKKSERLPQCHLCNHNHFDKIVVISSNITSKKKKNKRKNKSKKGNVKRRTPVKADKKEEKVEKKSVKSTKFYQRLVNLFCCCFRT